MASWRCDWITERSQRAAMVSRRFRRSLGSCLARRHFRFYEVSERNIPAARDRRRVLPFAMRESTMKYRPAVLLAALQAIILLGAGPTSAQYGFGAQATLIDSSVRLSGMGRSGAAVFWGG